MTEAYYTIATGPENDAEVVKHFDGDPVRFATLVEANKYLEDIAKDRPGWLSSRFRPTKVA